MRPVVMGDLFEEFPVLPERECVLELTSRDCRDWPHDIRD